jgi:hypothetical protein
VRLSLPCFSSPQQHTPSCRLDVRVLSPPRAYQAAVRERPLALPTCSLN